MVAIETTPAPINDAFADFPAADCPRIPAQVTGPRDVFEDWDDLATEEALKATAWEFGPTNSPFQPVWDLPGTGLMLAVLAIDPAAREPDDADRSNRFNVFYNAGDGEEADGAQFATLARALAWADNWLVTGPRRLPADLLAPITDLASGKAWLAALVADGRAFHLEDNPADISGPEEGQTFHPADVALIRERQSDLYGLTWGADPSEHCPIGYMMSLEAFAGLLGDDYEITPWTGF